MQKPSAGSFFIAVVAQAVDAHDVTVLEPRRRAAEDEVDIALNAAMTVDLPLRDARQELRRADKAVLLDFAGRQGRGEQRILAGFERAVLAMEAVAVHIEGKRLTDLLARICAVLHRHVAECAVAGIDKQRCRAERAAFLPSGRISVAPSCQVMRVVSALSPSMRVRGRRSAIFSSYTPGAR